jgi:hypothetical protein
MSLGLYKASRMVKVTDPRLDFDEVGVQVISDSATQLIYNKFPSSNPVGSVIKFNTTQTPTQAVSTKMFIECDFEVVITSDGAGANTYRPGFDAPRFMPLHSVTTNAKIEINGAANDIYPIEIVDALMRYNNTITELGQDLSTFPSFLDMYQMYDQGYRDGAGAAIGFGTACNALAQLGEAGPAYEPRGGWRLLSNARVGNVVTLTFRTFEPVVISPLVWGHDNHKSLYGVKNLNITYNLATDLSRVWSRNIVGLAAPDISVTARVIGNPQLCLITMTPKLIDMINPVQIYPWAQLQNYNTNYGPLASGDTVRVNFNAQQLGGVPRRVYFYAKKTNKDVYDTDTFARISKVDIRFDNVQGIFANATNEQLFQVCAENGYRGSFQDFNNYAGSVMAIDFTKDIPMMDYMSVGSNKNINFQISCDITNIRPAGAPDITYTFYVIVVYEGIFSIDQFGTPLYQLNTLSASDVLNSAGCQKIPYHAIDTFALGGSFSSKLSNMGNFAKKLGRKAIGAYESLSPESKQGIANVVTDAATLISPALSKAITDFGPAAYERAKQLVGMGYSEDQIYALIAGAGVKKKKKPATGGKKLTKAQIMKMASA